MTPRRSHSHHTEKKEKDYRILGCDPSAFGMLVFSIVAAVVPVFVAHRDATPAPADVVPTIPTDQRVGAVEDTMPRCVVIRRTHRVNVVGVTAADISRPIDYK